MYNFENKDICHLDSYLLHRNVTTRIFRIKKNLAYRADKLDVEELPEGWWSEIPGWMAASLSASLK